MQRQRPEWQERLAQTGYERYQLSYVLKAAEAEHFWGFLVVYLLMGVLGLVFGPKHMSLWGWVYVGVMGPLTMVQKRAVAHLLTAPEAWWATKGLEGFLWRTRHRWPKPFVGFVFWSAGMGIVLLPLLKADQPWEVSLIVGMSLALVGSVLHLGQLHSRFLVRREETVQRNQS